MQITRIKTVLLLGLILALVLPTSSLTLYYASVQGQTGTSLYGSVKGGTKIMIRGSGFPSDYTQIQVFVGSYQCILEDGVPPSTTSISCFTSDSGSQSDKKNLQITVYYAGEPIKLSSYTFSYLYNQSPYLYDVAPSTSMASDYLYFTGWHRVDHNSIDPKDTQSILGIYVDTELCNIIDVPQDFSKTDWASIQCVSSSLQEGGKYNVSEHVKPGYAVKSEYMKKTSMVEGEYYEHTVLPTVSQVTPNSGLPNGQDLVITGTGFSYDKQKVSVTVDGVDCSITSSTTQSIACTLAKKTGTTLLPTDAASQIKGYVGGSGFQYTKYEINDLGNKVYSSLRNAVETSQGMISVVETGILGELQTVSESGTYGKSLKGYFYAPVSGDYIFRGAGDDNFGLYMSDNYGTAEVNPTPYIYQNQYTSNKDNYYISNYTSALGASRYLEGGKHYYMELYMVNAGGSGFVKISVEVPNTNYKLVWQRHEVNQIQTSFTNDPQIRTFTLEGESPLSGTFILTHTYKSSPLSLESITTTVELPYNASASQFKTNLQKFSLFSSSYGISVTLEIFDENGNQVASDLGSKFVWTASIWRKRDDSLVTQKLSYNLNGISSNGTTVTFTEETFHEHGDLISGTYSIEIGSQSVQVFDSATNTYTSNIPYNIDRVSLQSGIRRIAGLQAVEVLQLTSDCDYGCLYLITYFKYNNDVPDLVISSAQLLGGKAGTFPIASFFETRKYSSNLIFNPVDERMLFTAVDNPHIHVTVNDVLSACVGACAYTFQANNPTVTSQSLSSSQISLTIADPQTKNYDLSLLTITVDNQPCTNVVGTFTSFTCDLPTNSDGTPTVQAGSHNVEVWVQNEGLLELQSSVSALDFPFSIISASPSTGGLNGGYDIIVTGEGFPLNVEDAEITLCGTKITPHTTNNIQTTFTAPECQIGVQTLTYTYNGESKTFDFEYVDAPGTPTITSISPHSANPTLKGVMEIEGTDFAVNSNDMKVYLANASGNVYEMRILESNDTYIKCGIPGGLPGNFEVLVQINGQGNALASPVTANDFVYELVITGISPAQGQYHGGTLITISGRNFSPDIRETLITVGHEMNWLCTVQDISETQITCRVPPYHPDWSSNTQDVILTNRLIIDSTCEGSCQFSYLTELDSLRLLSLSATSFTSKTGTLTLTGSNFGLGNLNDLQVIFVNKLTNEEYSVTPKTSSSSQIVIDVPSVEAGTYGVKVRLDPIGETNAFEVTIKSSLTTTSSSGSINGGSIILVGKGLPAKWPQNLWSITISSNGKPQDIEVISISETRIELGVKQGVDGQIYSISILNPLGTTLTSTFTQLQTKTPQISYQTSTLTAGPQTITLSIDSLATQTPSKVYYYNILNEDNLIEASFTKNSATITSTIDFTSGGYKFKVWYNNLGWASVTGQLSIDITGSYTVVNTASSFAGGEFVVTGDNINPSSVIRIGGFEGKILREQGGNTIFQVPPLITIETVGWYSPLLSVEKIEPFAVISDGGVDPQNIIDNRHHTEYSSTNINCYVGVDMGENRVVNPRRIRYFPFSEWAVVANYLKGAIVEGSMHETSNYEQLGVVGPEVHSGWNSFLVDTNKNYRYFRIRHTDQSACMVGELQIIGVLYNDLAATTNTILDVIFDDGANQITWAGMITYRQDTTPVIQSLSTTTGSIYGGYTLTLNGQNLGDLTILIDEIPCTVQTFTATAVICEVGQRLTLPTENSFVVSLNGNKAVIEEQFIYVMRWSDIRTWGTDLLPVTGDLVYVPKGMTLYVDQTTPVLEGIVVEEGKIVFADEGPMQIHTGFITLVSGEFRAGTKDKPYQNELKFIMYGNYYGTQQPMFGNKGIGCKECKFSMHGKIRPVTWTMLQNTINPGDTSFDVIDNGIDWAVGEEIVVASSDFDHKQAEQRTIIAVSGVTVTVSEPFNYEHYAGVETHGSDTLQMRAEVGLLTRNIKMMGDETSEGSQYGSHLMMAGSAEQGMVSHIAYTEFTHCGQPKIVGRYCIHFHMNGDVVDSEVTGNAVHHSFARVLTLHAIQYLRVKDNVGYWVRGHNFFIEDGIETHNILDHNLAISSLQAFNMMQTDTSVASFWVTNPLNDLINNHAAGGDFYGFWYEVKPHPDGPSANEDICPMGNPLGASHDNVAHSYLRFGLRIFKLYSREKPCGAIRNDALEDPWSQNPSIQSRFYNYLTYKIGEAGLLAEEVGNMIFENFTIAECKLAGMEFYRTNLTEELVVAKDIAIIGVSSGNPANANDLSGLRGVIGPRTGGWKMQNVRFYDFTSTMTVFETCSKCDSPKLYSNKALEYFVSNLQFTNISGSYLFQNGLKRIIIYDLDASFSAQFDSVSRTSATFVPYYPHLAQEPGCISSSAPSNWDNSLVCDESVIIRGVTITNPLPLMTFKSIGMKVQRIDSLDEIVPEDSTDYSEFYSLFGNMEPKNKEFAWSMPYVAGRIYNVWWLTGLDFTHMAIQVTTLFQDSDPAIFFKFNYTENRELFEIGDLVNRQIVGDYRNQSDDTLDPMLCSLGDYLHNNQIVECDNDTLNATACNVTEMQRNLTVCLSSRGKNQTRQYLDINGIRCRYLCPSPTGQFVKEDRLRYWSHPSDWPTGQIPQPGENVTIQGSWTMLLDMQPNQIQFLHIDGDLIIPDTMASVHIIAHSIWIRAGMLIAGTQSVPHPGKVTIEIRGNKGDAGYVLTPEIAGTKLFVVHGRLHLYGETPATSWTRMTEFVNAGASEITVDSSSGWNIGDELTIAPSFSSGSQHEKVTITGIADKKITFTPALKYSHYGAPSVTISNTFGTLDTRTAVGVLTKKIKIISGNDSGWGYRLLVNSYLDGEIQRKGHLVLQGVELNEGGQYDTQYAATTLMTVLSQEQTIIKKSTFYNCKSYCLYLNGAVNVDVSDNVFYIGRINHVRALTLVNYEFTNNLMISAIKRPTIASASDLIACYASWEEVDSTVQVKGNICQGSDLHGFALGFSPCESQSISYSDNTASSAPACFIFNKISSSKCMKASGIKAFACGIGQISSPPNTESIIFEDFMVADSERAVTLRFGKQGDDRSAFFRNSYITAISRLDCPQCYGSGLIDCSNNQGVRMLAVTVNGESMPMKFGTGFDVICKQQTFDAKAFIDNVVFQNFRTSYSTLSQCSNNVVFKSHPGAMDMTGSHNLRNTVCQNCQFNSLAYFQPPNPAFLTWFGGCGTIFCTGKNNYLIHDYTGGFLPSAGVLLANNSDIGDNTEGCTYSSAMNGHYCTQEDFGVLEYESVAPDYNTRIMWPVYLRYDGGSWNTSTNGWREWEWEGNQPLNKRLGRFVSIVELSRTYNMTFESQPPIDMRLQFQKRSVTGNNSEYIIVKLHYPRPNSIRVQNKGITIKPITQLPGNTEPYLDTTVCGSNKFYYKNYTVHFVVTGDPNCQVRVSLTNSIQLTARFNMDINNFFDIDGPTKFIDRMCALLQINDTSRLKVVGIYSGSTIVEAYLQEEAPLLQNAQAYDNVEGAQKIADLQILLMSLYENGQIGETLAAEGFGQIIQFNSVKYDHLVGESSPLDPDDPGTYIGPDVDKFVQSNLGLVIGLSCGGLSIVVAIIVGVIYMVRKRNKVAAQMQSMQTQQQRIESTQVDENFSVIQFQEKK